MSNEIEVNETLTTTDNTKTLYNAIDRIKELEAELEAIKKVTQGDVKLSIYDDYSIEIKEWLSANVYDGESVRDPSEKVIFRGDQLQELIIEIYNDLFGLNLGDM